MSNDNDSQEPKDEEAPAEEPAADGGPDEAADSESEGNGAEAADVEGGDETGDAEDDVSPWAQDPAARIAELEAEVEAIKDQFLRAMAEAENVRKRSERQLSEAHKYGIANFARAILPVADDLTRALMAVPEDQREGDELVQNLLGGVEAVERELAKALETHNIERIDPLGEPFDPNLHEAMFEVPVSDQPSGTVAQVLQPGYRLHDRLLRPARVGVAKGDGGAPEPKVDTTV